MNEEKNIIKRHLSCKEITKQCLEGDDRCRNDDIWLLINVWRRQGANIFIDYSQMKRLYMPESISRCRREIQHSDGQHRPDKATLEKRGKKEDALYNYYAERARV